MNLSFADFFLLLPLRRNLRHAFRLNVQRSFLPVKVCVFRVLDLRIPNPGIQEQTVEQFLLVVHGRNCRQ
jgi:hypothetical protein